jgi:hypothetical protein
MNSQSITPQGEKGGNDVFVASRGATPVFDPNCPRERTDVNCDGFSTVQDVVKVVNVAFRGANPATEFCGPCGR